MTSMKKRITAILLVCLSICMLMAGCASQPSALQASGTEIVEVENTPVPFGQVPVLSSVLVPTASGTAVYESGSVTIDASNVAQGYVMVKYAGSNSKIKVRVTRKDNTTYTYDLNARDAYEVFPLTSGSGTYTVQVLENVQGTSYAQVTAQEIDVQLTNEYLPFLYPNQYVNFTDTSKAVAKAAELAKDAKDDSTVVQNVYNYVVNNVTYDTAKANSVKSGYLPNVDSTLDTKAGICFDYAALMAAMLRSQNIPTKLVIGYTGDIYHAWLNVYLSKEGWVDNLIYFDGTTWKLMDPTFAASGKGDESIRKYIGDAANYQQKYTY